MGPVQFQNAGIAGAKRKTKLKMVNGLPAGHFQFDFPGVLSYVIYAILPAVSLPVSLQGIRQTSSAYL